MTSLARSNASNARFARRIHVSSSSSSSSARAKTRAQAVKKPIDDGFATRALDVFRDRERMMASSDEARASTITLAPSTANEEYRFTDFKFLTQCERFERASARNVRFESDANANASRGARVTLVDGTMDRSRTNVEAVDSGVLVGMASDVGRDRTMGEQSAKRGNVFAGLNAASATDALVIRARAGVKCATPINVATLSTGASESGVIRVSAPRMTVVVEENAELILVEDFAGEGEAAYWQNGVCEIVLEKGASLKHSIVQNHGRGAVHTRTTLVTQAEESKYELNEISVGGKTARHDLSIKQLGPRTETVLGCFILAGAEQTLDLHSKLQLDFEEGKSNQVHKCIVSAATGRGVFDGNVQVNRFAQRTDAKQLSRNLLLVPKATVNVKPNLQIVADDVKCTHGCTVSDLEEEELFYIQSRGLSVETARSLLVSGFGVEIISRLPGKELRERVNSIVRAALQRDRVQFQWTGDK